MSLKEKIKNVKIKAMKEKNKELNQALTLILSKIKQYEVDKRVSLDENNEVVTDILTKMVKERQESAKLYHKGGRKELALKEEFEISTIEKFLPEKLSEDEVMSLIELAFEKVNPKSMKDMKLIMAELKPQLVGKADMGKVSSIIRSRLQ